MCDEQYRDPDQWGEPEPAPKRPRRRLSSMFSVRLKPSELDAVRTAALRVGVSVSAFLRSAALFAAQDPKPGVQQLDTRAATLEVHVLSAPPGFSLNGSNTFNAAFGPGSVHPGSET